MCVLVLLLPFLVVGRSGLERVSQRTSDGSQKDCGTPGKRQMALPRDYRSDGDDQWSTHDTSVADSSGAHLVIYRFPPIR
jgi:hypothetical protein